ncbi:MAG: sugar ABC transporter substrate-binding protein [Candidatus Goldbacteria bacterium]|nr:sugar ABC transporter substrate-binding protein [Candidatus Goldiibacteriota bacterium]
MKNFFKILISAVMFFASFCLYAEELTVWNMPADADTLQKKVWNEGIKSFESNNLDIKVRGISREYKPQEFVSVMASGKGPDVVRIPITAVPVMAKHGFLADLSGYTADWIQKDYMPKIMWDSVDINGKIYGVPYDSFFTVMFYRKDIFDRCGITKAPETWEDIIKYSAIINSKTGDVYGIGLQPDMFYFVDFIWQAGGSVFTGGKLALNEPAVAQALKFWHALKWKYRATPPTDILYEADVEQLFSSGKIAMMPAVAKRLPVMARRYGLDMKNVEIVPLPAGPQGIKAWHAGGEAFIVNSSISPSKKDKAWRYIQYELSPPAQLGKYIRMKNLQLPIFPGDFSCATNLINMPEFANIKGLFEYAHIEPPLYEWPMIKEDFNRSVLEKIFTNREVDFEGVIYEFEKKIKAEYNE